MINAMISSVLQPGVVLLTALGVYALARRRSSPGIPASRSELWRVSSV